MGDAEPMDEPKPLRVEVDFDLCQAHAECQAEAPDWFTVPKGPEAKVRAKRGAIPDDQLAAVRDAVKYCPTQALRLVDTQPTQE